MTWRTHAAGGLASLWLLAPLPGVLTDNDLGALAAAAALGALLPDLDAADSKARRLALGGVRPLEPLGGALHGLFGHRDFLHSLPGWLGLGAGCLVLGLWTPWPNSSWQVPVACFAGYGSHLALDACTVSGIPLLPERRGDGRWGLGRRRHLLPRRFRLVTGSDAEDIVFALLALAALALLLPILLPPSLPGQA